MGEGATTTQRAEYPRRPRFFSHRFIRLIARVCLANDLGPEVCWLLTVIVNTEDAKGYRGAVTFFNDQLATVAGFGSDSSLDRFRRKAVEAGWLHYEPGGRRRAGRYWVTIPERFEDVKDGPLDHDPGEYTNADPSPSPAGDKRELSGSYPGDKREQSGNKAGVIREQSGEPSSLTLPQDKDPPNPPSGGEGGKAGSKAGASQSRRDRERRKREEAEAVRAIPIPDALGTPDFAECWATWQAYRAEIKHALTVTTARGQLKKLAKEGAAAAAERIERSIANQWRGLWMPNEQRAPPAKAAAAQPAARPLTDEEIAHGTYSPTAGFQPDTKTCNDPACPRCRGQRKDADDGVEFE